MASPVAIGLAGLGSLGLAGGSALQHRSVVGGGQTMTRRQLAAMVRQPGWLTGMLVIVVATLLNLAALRLAPVMVVQPLGVMAIVWSVLLSPSSCRGRPGRDTWGSIAVIVTGLSGFTLCSSAVITAAESTPGLGRIIVGAVVCCLVGATLAAVHRLVPARLGCLMLAAAGAVLFGLTASLVRLGFTLLACGQGFLSTPVLLAAAGAMAASLVGGLAVQQAHALGRAEIVVAALTTVDPVVSAILGLAVLGEGKMASSSTVAAMSVCGMVAAIGVAALSRVRSDERSETGLQAMSTPPHCRMGRLRVALVSDYTLSTLGGAESAFAEQARALAEVCDVLVACPGSRSLADLGRCGHVTVVPVPVSFILPGLGLPVTRNTTPLRGLLRRAFTDSGIDVVHVHSEFGIAAAAIDVSHDMGIPVVETVHTFFWQAPARAQTLLRRAGPRFHRLVTGYGSTTAHLSDRPGDSALRNMTLTTALQVDRVVSPSAHQAVRLRTAGLPHVDVVPNTVSANPNARPVTVIDGPLRVLWMGRFAPEKRVLQFLDAAMEALEVVGPDLLRVDLVGTGPQFCAAARMLNERTGIVLHGRVDHDDIPKWLARSHCSALSSVGWDNQPMTVAESITALRGVIWCDPALTEGLDRAGIPAFGCNGLTRCLIDLAVDPAPVIAASADAVEARELFGTDHFVQTTMDVYQRATDADPAHAAHEAGSRA